MTRIKPMRPPYQKTAVMTDAEEKAYMKTFRGRNCEVCGAADNGTVVGCHMNAGLGGTGYRVKGAIFAGCHDCHAILDGRQGNQDEQLSLLRALVRRLLMARAETVSHNTLSDDSGETTR